MTRLNKSEYTWANHLWFGVVGFGAAAMVRVAGSLVADTLLASVTTARNSGEPGVVKPLTVNVGVVAPVTPGPSLRLLNVAALSVEICHCTARDVVPPLLATVKVSESDWPTVAPAF